MNISFCRDKRLDGQRGGYFQGIYSVHEDENMLGVVDLAFEAFILSSGNDDTKDSSRVPAKVIDVPMVLDDEDMFIDFDA